MADQESLVESALADGSLADLPENWSVEGPTTTEKGSRYYVLRGTITDTQYGLDRTVKLVAWRPPDGEWEATTSRRGGKGRRTLCEGRESACIKALVAEAKRTNARWNAIEGFAAPVVD